MPQIGFCALKQSCKKNNINKASVTKIKQQSILQYGKTMFKGLAFV